jgi:hypothetical protein
LTHARRSVAVAESAWYAQTCTAGGIRSGIDGSLRVVGGPAEQTHDE